MIVAKPNTSRWRVFQLLTVQPSSQSTMGHASCGLIVASARIAPPQKRNPLATQAAEPASSAATNKLNCCSLIPCTAGTLPRVSAIATATTTGGGLQLSARNQRGTVAAVAAISSQ